MIKKKLRIICGKIFDKKMMWVLKGIVTVLLVCTVTGVIVRDWNDLYYVEQPSNLGVDGQVAYAEINMDKTLVQSFQAKSGHVRSISVLFGTYNDTLEKGKVRFVLKNEKDQQLYHEVVDIKDLHDNCYYDFVIDQELDAGKYYSYEISAYGYGNSVTPVVWAGDDDESASSLYYDGEKQDKEIYSRMEIEKFKWTPVILNIVMLILMVCLLFVPFKCPEKVTTVLGIAGMIVFPFVSFCLVEGLYSDSFFHSAISIVWNYLLLLAFYLLCLVVCGSFRRAVIAGNTITFILGLINYFVMEFRGNPICPWDIFSLNTALDVAGGYNYRFDVIVVSRIMCALVINLFAMQFARQRIKLPVRLITGVGTAAYILGIFSVLWGTTYLEDNGYQDDLWVPRTGYLRNGFYLSFAMNMKYLQVEKPDGYSTAQVQEILDDYSVEQDAETDIKPDIIMIMNEAYSDLSVVGDFDTNEDYMPFVRNLEDNTAKGSLYVSIFGGGTCNTEYEVLTGNSMAYLAPGSITYQQYVRDGYDTGGLVQTLKEQDYVCYAIHPAVAGNWYRNIVYGSMGFDAFYDIFSFPEDAERVRSGFVSDRETYNKIIELYENKDKNEPLFVFDVTIQNHGGYESGYEFETPITLQGMSGEYPETEEYLSAMRMSDEAFEYLIEYFNKEENPVMIIMFGDHQPGIEEEFYEELYGKSLDELDLEELQKRYEVPFIIWTNYSSGSSSDLEMSANYLSAEVLSRAGLSVPAYYTFLNEMKEDVPVLNVNGCKDLDNNYTSLEDCKYSDWIEKYRILHYNSSIDRKNTLHSMYQSVD